MIYAHRYYNMLSALIKTLNNQTILGSIQYNSRKK